MAVLAVFQPAPQRRGSRTSHHLIIVSKHFRGYEIMKETIAKESSSAEHGVASFEYNPARRDQGRSSLLDRSTTWLIS